MNLIILLLRHDDPIPRFNEKLLIDNIIIAIDNLNTIKFVNKKTDNKNKTYEFKAYSSFLYDIQLNVAQYFEKILEKNFVDESDTKTYFKKGKKMILFI